MTQGQEFRVAVGRSRRRPAILESVVGIVTWGLAGLEQRVARNVVPNICSGCSV